MPCALLLSPDDQAVSAISAVLEEISVSCERPLDGVSAAQKLTARSFDLVLVDCENLPAAKLIFDVCRRGKNGINPVPIAIVDGRAGLPTAFRLGAELILTKPVAKDQARGTIRTAVNRLRKEEPARTVQPPDAASVAETPAPPEERSQAAAAAASSQPPEISKDTPKPALDLPPAPVISTAVKEIAAPPAAPLPEAVSHAEPSMAKAVALASKPTPPAKLSDDPVLADLERGDSVSSPARAFPSCAGTPPKSRSHMVAVLILALAGGGIYAAWMYQPEFRALVQPIVNRVLAIAGVASHQGAAAPQAPARLPKPLAVKPTALPVEVPPTVSATDATQAQGLSATPQAGTAPRISATAPVATTPSPASTAATKKPESSDSKKTESATAPSGRSSTDEDAVVLSSKGAEKRLLRHVQPGYPSGANLQGLEGTVVLKTTVDGTGRVESVHLVEGNPVLGDAAIRAVEQWRYRPYVRDGKSLPFQTVVLVDFQRP